MPSKRRPLLLAGAAGLVGLAAGPLRAQPVASEAEVKAAYLHKFAGFVDWPDGTFAAVDSPVVIGVAGADAVHDALAQLAKQRVPAGARPTVVRRVAPDARPRPSDPLHVLHVGADAGPEAAGLLAAQRNAPVLTTTDLPSGLASGAILAFVVREGRVRFEASLPAAQAAGLRLSSRLLAVASRVREAGG